MISNTKRKAQIALIEMKSNAIMLRAQAMMSANQMREMLGGEPKYFEGQFQAGSDMMRGLTAEMEEIIGGFDAET